MIENTTISGNTAAVGGGGIFHDADGELKLVNLTIWRNSAPRGGGIGVVESDFVAGGPAEGERRGHRCATRSSAAASTAAAATGTSPPRAATSTAAARRRLSSNGEGPALPGSDRLLPLSRRRTAIRRRPERSATAAATTFAPDAIADNGGPTLTHALTTAAWPSTAASAPALETDQRGIKRPQNGRCDTGAFEFVGDPPPPDDMPPDTQYLSGPIQDTLETVAFQFTGSDPST